MKVYLLVTMVFFIASLFGRIDGLINRTTPGSDDDVTILYQSLFDLSLICWAVYLLAQK